jgi:hypothetical protein
MTNETLLVFAIFSALLGGINFGLFLAWLFGISEFHFPWSPVITALISFLFTIVCVLKYVTIIHGANL